MRLVRAKAAHAVALRQFRCAGPAPFEQEVEAYIQGVLARREPLVTALVDVENVRSLRLLARPPFEFREDPIPELRKRDDGSVATYRYLEKRFAHRSS